MNIFQENITAKLKELKDQRGIDKYKDSPFNSLIVNGKTLTQSDVWGIMRLDKNLGYSVKEKSTSTNQWWRSNNIGARSTNDTEYLKSDDYQRILFFGDSFTQGTAIAQEENFIYHLNQRNKRIEAINLGVNGYSLGQSFIRFKSLKNKVEFDHVVLVFVPDCNLAREINISRYIGFGWDGFNDLILMPRFMVIDNKLALIPSPYHTINDFLDDSPKNVKDTIVDHLRKYDAFYYNFWYEKHSVLDNSILYKLILYIRFKSTRGNILANLWDTNGEALIVTKAVIQSMALEVESKGAKFTLLILPTNEDIDRYTKYSEFKKSWREMHSFLCNEIISCYDLIEDLRGFNEYIDTGYDGTHYGPNTHRKIANIILDEVINN